MRTIGAPLLLSLVFLMACPNKETPLPEAPEEKGTVMDHGTERPEQDEAVAPDPKQECPDGRMIYEWIPSEARCMDNYCPTPPSGHVWTLKWGYQDSHKKALVFCNELKQLSRFCRTYPLTPNPSGPQRVFWCEPQR